MKKSAVVALILVTIALVACGAAADEPAQTTALPATTTTAPLPPFPGTYATSVTPEDLSQAGVNNPGLAGEWLLTFPAVQGVTTYEASLDDMRVWQGTIQVEGNVIRITTADTDKKCEGEGVYTWTFDGAQLILTPESDDCVNRVIILAGHPLVRQQ